MHIARSVFAGDDVNYISAVQCYFVLHQYTHSHPFAQTRMSSPSALEASFVFVGDEPKASEQATESEKSKSSSSVRHTP